MMKMKRTFFAAATIAFAAWGTVALSGCSRGEQNSATNTAEKIDTAAVKPDTYLDAINHYLVDEIGKNYAPGELSIPSVAVVHVQEENPDSIKVWGDYWVFQYNISGDTLKTVSGGSHPGMMLLRLTDEGYEVTGFEQAEDGSRYLPSAKAIFGKHYDAFHAINSDEKKRDEIRAEQIAEYVKKHHLPVTMYQDFGWDAIAIPATSTSR